MRRKSFKVCLILLLTICLFSVGCNDKKEKEPIEDNTLEKLPLPEITDGARGELGIDKNINEETIDKYLNRSDTVYRDMRMLEDPANYEAIDGDSKLSGYIKGFEIIPYPYIVNVTGLPSAVGNTYQGETLFSIDGNGKYVANYEESMSIIEKNFPKDKYIFLMCGGGGYAGMMKNFLVSLGWDSNKIYNVGGYWYYKGKNNVEVKKVVNGETTYDFDNVPYIKIDFDKLTKLANSNQITTKLTINQSKLTLNVKDKYRLNVVGAAINELNWSSSDSTIVAVTQTGIVQALKEGTATITVTTKDGSQSQTCKVKVNKAQSSKYLKLDDLSKEAKEFNDLSVEQLYLDFYEKIYTTNNKIKSKYLTNGKPNKLYQQESDNCDEQVKVNIKKRVNILNNLITNKKTFIILYADKDCLAKKFSVVLKSEEILKENNIDYFYINDYEDKTYSKSKLKDKKAYPGSIIIIRNGQVYAYTNPNKNAFHSVSAVKSWFKKYIDIK